MRHGHSTTEETVTQDEIIPKPIDPRFGGELVNDMRECARRTMHNPDGAIKKGLACSNDVLVSIVERFLERDATYHTFSKMGLISLDGVKIYLDEKNVELIAQHLINGRAVTLFIKEDLTPRQLIAFRLLFGIGCRPLHAAILPNPSYL